MATLYDGVFINLDRSTERRATLERQFAEHGVSGTYRRFAAIDGATLGGGGALSRGERGIFRSHQQMPGLVAGKRPLHVLEDDAVLSAATAPAIDTLIRNGIVNRYDLIFTETLVPQDLRALKEFKGLYDKVMGDGGGGLDPGRLQLIELAPLKFACASSYVINPNSVARLGEAYARGWASGPAQPFDLFLRAEVNARRLRAALLFPFVTSIDLPAIVDSTSGRANPPTRTARSAEVMAILRYSFFVGRDLAVADQRLAAILAETTGRKLDAHRALMEKAVGFILSNNFEAF